MTERSVYLRRGLNLALITISWNILEGIIAVIYAILSGSVALLGFGVDSFIEVASAVIVGWRLYYEMRGRSPQKIERAESIASRITGALLLALAAYLFVDSLWRILGSGKEPAPSLPGMILTAFSLAVMPLLARSKLKTSAVLKSAAMRADAFETVACAWLSAITLCGLALNAVFGWWWADPIAALALLPLIVREGLEGIRGEEEHDSISSDLD